MKILYLDKLGISGNLKSGYVDLYDRGGNKHRVDALFVPGYDWVPCARKLLNNFTNDARYLALVLTNTTYTSTIWITRPKVTYIEDWDELEENDNEPFFVSEYFDKYKIKKGERFFVVKRCKSIDKDNDGNWSEYDFCLGLVNGFDDSDKPIYDYFTYPGHLAAAVHFNEPLKGKYQDRLVLESGDEYYICDPTNYIPEPGVTMEGMDNSKANAIVLEM